MKTSRSRPVHFHFLSCRKQDKQKQSDSYCTITTGVEVDRLFSLIDKNSRNKVTCHKKTIARDASLRKERGYSAYGKDSSKPCVKLQWRAAMGLCICS